MYVTELRKKENMLVLVESNGKPLGRHVLGMEDDFPKIVGEEAERETAKKPGYAVVRRLEMGHFGGG